MVQHFHDPEYRRVLRSLRIAHWSFLPPMLVLLGILLLPLWGDFLSAGAFLAFFAAEALVIFLYIWTLKRLVRWEQAYKRRVGWTDRELTATGPLFEAIVQTYEAGHLGHFAQTLCPPRWHVSACDDHNGVITLVLEHRESELIIDLSDEEVVLHFDEEGADELLARPMASPDWPDMNALARWIREQHENYLQRKRESP